MDTADPETGTVRRSVIDRFGSHRLHLIALFGAVATSCLVGIRRRPLWLDESLSVGATSQLVDTWNFTGGTMAAYYAVLTPWAAVSHDRAWIRLLSVLFALAVLPTTYWFARQFCQRWEALLATALLGGSWAFTRYAQEARSYALAMLLTTLAWAVLAWWARTSLGSPSARRSLAIYTTLVVLALFAHGLTGLQVLAQMFAVSLLPDRARRLRALVPSVFACVAALSLLTVAGAAEVANWIPPLSVNQLGELLRTFTGPGVLAQVGIGAAITAGAHVAVSTYLRGAGDDGWLYGVTAVWALVPPVLLVLLSTSRPYLLPRYVLGSLPAMGLLAVLSLRLFDGRTVVVRCLAVGLVVLVFAGRSSLHDEPFDDWAAMAQAVSAEARVGDLIAFPTQTVRPAFDYAWSEIDAPVSPRVVSPVGPLGEVHRMYPYHGDDVVPALLAEEAPPRVWVIGADTVGRGDTLTPFLGDHRLVDYRVDRRHRFEGGLDLVLLVRR